jgi:hypothetical protein
MHCKCRVFLGFGLALWMLCGQSSGQIVGGSIVGIVTDPTGAVVAGAEVEATHVATNVISSTTTNQEGYYEFPNLPSGSYVLGFQMEGFQRATTGEIELHAGTRPRVDIEMVVGQVTETVEVVASAPLVNATTTELGVVIADQKIRELPLNGRTFTDLLNLQPGFNLSSSAANRGGVELNGLPGLGNNWLLDGIDMSFGENNGSGAGAIGGRGGLINTISIEAIQEFKTSSGAASAEYGRATGGTIMVTTRSGTNDFHGTLFHFLRNDKLDTSTFFANAFGLDKPGLRHNQYGGNIGGPVWRNKMFFFYNFEGARVVRTRSVTGDVATPELRRRIAENNQELADFFLFHPQDFVPTDDPLIGFHSRLDAERVQEDTHLFRYDAHLGANRFSFRLSWNDQEVSQPRLEPQFRRFFPLPLRNWGVSHNVTISPTMFNEVRFGFNHYPIQRAIRSINPEDNVDVPGAGPLTIEGRTVVAAGIDRVLTVDSLASDTPTWTFADNFSWIRGAHSFKMGFEFRNIDSTRTQFGQGTWHFYDSIDDLINDRIDRLELPFGNPTNGYAYNTYGGYFQDDWKINSRLQINLGMRYEYYEPFKGSIGLATTDPLGPRVMKGDPIYENDPNNFAPRAGIVYDITGSGKTILRLGAGITYGPPQPFFYYDAAWIDARVPFAPIVSVVDLPDTLKPLRFPFPDSFLEAVRNDPSQVPEGLTPGLLAPDRNRADEYSGQWNASLQHVLTDTLAVQVAYVGNRALKLYTSRLINPIDPNTGQRVSGQDIGPINYQTNGARSWYHALQLTANQKLSSGLTFDMYYTWSRAMAVGGSDGVFTADRLTQDPFDMNGSRGPKQGEINHRYTLVHSYEFPTPDFAQNSAIGRGFVGGWTVQGIMSWKSGQPLNITIGRDVVGNGNPNPQRPDAVEGVDPHVPFGPARQWLNRAAYDVEGPTNERRFGTLGFNTARGPAGFSWDAAIHKDFFIAEGHRITFRFEMFNMLNHVIFSNPERRLSRGNFGQIRSGSVGREIQLGLKYSF